MKLCLHFRSVTNAIHLLSNQATHAPENIIREKIEKHISSYYNMISALHQFKFDAHLVFGTFT